MAWNAKPRGAYAVGSDEWTANVWAFWEVCQKLGYSKEACAGMAGNSQGEGGMNPWRWQSDTVNMSAGYGLFQYTPASGYLDNYGRTSSYYAPNLSTSIITSGALATDGIAQIECIGASGKYGGGTVRVERIKPYYSDCENYQSLNDFKGIADVYGATVCWLGFFEAPKIIDQSVVNTRYSWAQQVYEVLGGTPPEPPEPPIPTPTDYIYYMVKIRRKRRLNI